MGDWGQERYAVVVAQLFAVMGLFLCYCTVLKFGCADNIFTLDVMDEPVIAADGFTYEKR